MHSGLANIHPKTKISALIKANAEVINALSELNPHFKKLHNPVLRKLLASRVTIDDACRISGSKLEDFMSKMRELGFNTNTSLEPNITTPSESSISTLFQNLTAIQLDVRPALASGNDPLKLILTAIDGLKPTECLKLINTFEPLPLITLLAKRGFASYTERQKPDEVITWFAKSENSVLPAEDIPIADSDAEEFNTIFESFSPDNLHSIDVRELAMPLPMVTILSELKNLPKQKALFVLHKKVPVYLLPELKDRGFSYLIQNTPDDKVNLLIYRA